MYKIMMGSPCFLIVGGDSAIAHSLYLALSPIGKVITTSRRRLHDGLFLDLREESNYMQFLSKVKEEGVTHVIWLAAITSEEKCQANPKLAYQINVKATHKLIKELSGSCHITFFSSSSVFSPHEPSPSIASHFQPNTLYGELKAQVEERLRGINNPIAIIRATKVLVTPFALFEKLKDCINKEETFPAFNDHYISPVSIEYLVREVLQVIVNSAVGVYHFSGSENISYSDFILSAIKYLGGNESIVRIVSADEYQVARVRYAKIASYHYVLGEVAGQPLQNVFMDYFHSSDSYQF